MGRPKKTKVEQVEQPKIEQQVEVVKVEDPKPEPVEQTKEPKQKRKASPYALFVKEHYNDEDIKAIVNSKDKIKKLASKWKDSKSKQ